MPDSDDATKTDQPASKAEHADEKPIQTARRRGRPRTADVVAQLTELGGVTSRPEGPTDA
jgi:hypothetical protein